MSLVFGFSPRYKKRTDKVTWNRKGVLECVVRELTEFNARLVGNTVITIGDSRAGVTLDYIVSNSGDEKLLEMNASVSILINDEAYDWCDLFHFTRQYYPENHRPLTIYRDQMWEGSSFQKECQEVLLPLTAILLDADSRDKFLSGEVAKWRNVELRLSHHEDFEWIVRSSNNVLQQSKRKPKRV